MGKLVMVVESDHEHRVHIRRILESAGYLVVSAANGADGLSQLQNITRPAVILLAGRMALMDGDEFVRLLQKKPEYASIPILHLANENEPSLQGSCGLVQKSAISSDLLNEIKRCLVED